MGSASRPHRLSRSSKVSYKDSEEEDEEFSVAHESIPSKPSESKDFARRNLALKKISRSQERAEALQIQKAIEESLSQGEGNGNARQVSINAVDDSKKVEDSEDDDPNVHSNTTNEAVLQCPYTEPNQEISNSIPSGDCPQEQEMQIALSETAHGDNASTGQGLICKVDLSSSEAMNTNTKVSKAMKEKDDVDWSSEHDDNDNDDDENVTEDESSDASEDLKRKRKGPVKSQQKGKKASEKEQKHLTASVKRPRSSRAVPEAGTRLTTKKSLPSKGIGSKPLALATHAVCKNETSKKHVAVFRECKEPGGKGVSLKSCKSALVHDQKSHALHSNAAIFDNASCETPGILSLSARSPTGLHRRVIGLSRRFKPPPLHPYLPRMEG